MARLAMRVKEQKRLKLATRYNAKRADLKKKAIDFNLTEEERDAARVALQKLPKNSAPARQRKRCKLTGRPRGFVGDFGICRNEFRRLASYGQIPGVTKASW
ncbi:MAG: 30S ribosomal protein S14 [Bdellovibrionales bacterium]|jgi:small subunit ribosomal protein S14|nr:30S ribosomal protein S14 [Bdellovibrionales bacterium]